MAKTPKKDAISVLRRTKRSGAYIPKSDGSGITKAPKAQQKVFKKEIKAKIKQVKNG
jgi:hypothetical protein